MKKPITLAAAGAALFFGGCETPAGAPATGAAVPAGAAGRAMSIKGEQLLIPAAKVNALTRGMTGMMVRDLIGAPQRKAPFPSGGPAAQVWTYRVSVSETARQIAVEMRDVPTFDPITGRMIEHKEPVYQTEHIRTYRTLELLMIDDRLTERKPGSDVERFFQ